MGYSKISATSLQNVGCSRSGVDPLFELKTETTLERPLAEVFSFFSDAYNLEALTPPFLRFEVLTPGPIEMKKGTLIDYRLKVHGVSIRWRSEISVWEPPHRFVDEQRRGPYRSWVHEHRFEEKDGATLVTDWVRYNHLGGRLVNRFFVAPDLARIFRFRQQKLKEIFS